MTQHVFPTQGETQLLADMAQELRIRGDMYSGGSEVRVREIAADWVGCGFTPSEASAWMDVGFWDHDAADALRAANVNPRLAERRAKALQAGDYAERDVIYDICNGDLPVSLLTA